MKKYLFPLILTFISFINAQSNETIVQLYNKLPSDNKKIIYETGVGLGNKYIYNVKNEGDSWTFQSLYSEEPNEDNKKPIIDIKNGYISITDNVYAGIVMGIIHDAAVFNSNSSQRYVALNISIVYTMEMYYDFKLYKYQNESFIDVTSEKVPFIDVNNFSKTKLTKEELSILNKLFKNGIFYKIPRYGTDIIVSFDDQVLKDYDNSDESSKEFVVVEKFKNSLNNKKIILKWDKKNERFIK